ncbi:MAG: SusC/RagA family TonB-linked outer membrane protein [Bacteroidales bacterium]
MKNKHWFMTLFLIGMNVCLVFGQSRTITGIVTDTDNQTPLTGASVVRQGSSTGTITDVDGKYSIQVTSPSDVLVFSFVGMQPVKVTVGDKSVINVNMVGDAQLINEVVVTAMGIERKSESLTYASQNMAGSTITRAKDPNMINALQGKTSGLIITPNASGAGGSSKVLLRGNKSAQGNNQPLVVIDGVPMSNPATTQLSGEFYGRDGGSALANLNPEDIASINVLKGASAAALYGSMAANGVLMITTKKGREGSARVDFSSSVQLETLLAAPKLQDQYGAIVTGDQLSAKSWGDKLTEKSTGADRMSEFFRTGSTYINSVAVNGGTEKIKSYLSYANTTALGITPTNDFYRHNMNLRETFNLFDNKLQIDGNLNYIVQKGINRPHGGVYFNPLCGMYTFPANGDFKYYKKNYEVFDPAQNMMVQNWYTPLDDFTQNPYWVLNRNKSIERRNRMMASGSVRWNITDYLNVLGRLSYDKTVDNFEHRFYASTTQTLVPANGRFWKEDFDTRQFYGDFLVNFDKTVGDFALSASVGTSFMSFNAYTLRIDSDKLGLVIPNYFVPENINGNGIQRMENPRKRLNSVFGTAQIGFREMLYLDVTGRNDWSSTLAYTHNESYFYPSVGLSALVNRMITMPTAINQLKLRGSYSVVGNDMPAYITYPKDGFNLGQLETNNKAPFTEMKPEKMHSMEFGFDLALFDNSINIDFTYYKTNNKNQYFQISAPMASGYEQLYINTGNIQNSGIESTISYTKSFNEDWSWKTDFNMAYNDNKIKELDPRLGNYVTIGEGAGFRFILKEGGSYGDIYTRVLERENGVIKVDANGRPIVSSDYEYVGNVNSKWQLGWGNTINYKDWNLYFLIDGRIGGKTVGMTQSYLDSWGVTESTAKARNKGGVDRGNGELIDAQVYYEAVAGKDKAGSEYTYDATNFRLRELSIGYTFRNLLGESKDLGISFIGRNLFFFHKDSPNDPDLSISTNNGWQGFDIFGLPATRSFGLSLRATF